MTVPSVDIDWHGMAAPEDETREDTVFVIVPLNTNTVEDIRHLLVQEPFDDTLKGLGFGRPVDPEITIWWSSRRTMGLLDPGGILHTDIFSLRKSARQAWPMELQVVPLAPELDFVARVEGQPAEGGKAIDTIRGRIVNVDIDIDANGDGAIDDTDEPIETNPGGFVAVGTNSLARINLKVEPAGLPRKVKLTATGGDRIRLWTTPARTTEVVLPATWNSVADMPASLYVEGVTNSVALRDVSLKLEYDENPAGSCDELFRCADHIFLTAFDMVLMDAGVPLGTNQFVHITSTPAMPALSARLVPEGLPGIAEWQLEVLYDRPDRGGYTGDHEILPIAGDSEAYTNLPAMGTWDIAAAFGEKIRGGASTARCKYSARPLERKFHIRGTNPSEAVAKAYLQANGPWFAYCIAKHESGRQNDHETGVARTYLQFNEAGAHQPDNSALRFCPNRGGGGNPYGWGMMQLDNIELPGQTTYRTPDNGDPWAQELWSWKANCDTAIQVLARKREMMAAHLHNIAPDGEGFIMPQDITIGDVEFRNGSNRLPCDADIIKLYNGGHFWTRYVRKNGVYEHVPISGDYTELVLECYDE